MRSLPWLAAALISFSCSSSQPLRDWPSDLRIRYAEGGGFTGRWSGASIVADGRVHVWTPGSTDTSAAIAVLSPEALGHLWAAIRDQRLLDGPSGGMSGNMTRVVILSASGRTVERRWSYGTPPDDSAQVYAAFYDRCLAAVAASRR